MKGSQVLATTLIIGESAEARQMARALTACGLPVILAKPSPADTAVGTDLGLGTNVEQVALANTFQLDGTVGHFRLAVPGSGETIEREVGAIVLVDAARRESNVARYGLSTANELLSFSLLAAMLDGSADVEAPFSKGQKMVLITGLATEGHPMMAEQAMRCALRLQADHGLQCYLMTGNLKVGADGLEALYRQTKSAGVVFMKFTETRPTFEVLPKGGFRVDFDDEVLHEPCTLDSEWLAVDEQVRPSALTLQVARRLGIDCGPDHFAQSDNVHRATVQTNRQGIFVAGSSRTVLTEADREIDAQNAVVEIQKCLQEPAVALLGKAVINTGRCIRCLTCFRSCPYGAVSVGSHVAIEPAACQACGICLAECPRQAIDFDRPPGGTIVDRIPVVPPAASGEDFAPAITAFCCQRSAEAAGALAACMAIALPPGLRLVPVPCAGSISLEHLLGAFSSGADGVLVLSCHPGNCHSEHGNERARQRAEQVGTILPRVGIDTARLAYATLAANMGVEFAETVNCFAQTLNKIGPSRLKS
jgi:coenzyme F420-reducing hydrogenase delta subunit/NAD-dependent dihydropyrimidine dehydrogenase PreA subunit